MQQKSHLCRHTEIANNKDAKFLEKSVTSKFKLVSLLVQKVLAHRQRTNLHYVADVQTLDPFILVQKAQNTAHVRLGILLVVIV